MKALSLPLGLALASLAGFPQPSSAAQLLAQTAVDLRSTGEAPALPPSTTLDLRASLLIGKSVRNLQGEHLGEVRDLVLDVNNQRVHYAVLSFGGFLGLDHRLFAYPIALFQSSGPGKELLLNLDRDQLRKAPGFSREHWPDWADKRYRSAVANHFGPTVSPLDLPDQRLVRASELMDRSVDDASGQEAGEVEDIIVDLGNGRVRYVVLEVEERGSHDRLLALPLPAFAVPDSQGDDLRLRLRREQLEGSAELGEGRWQELMNDPAYQRQLDRSLEALTPASLPSPASKPRR
ncbi:PRC-barrel domain-containing protein [Aquabacterium sp. A7-Y]|uniref:PRC-barrel domain-containing protein n=1 Tax=Aquabacterium sp. A7-Y TaxID=1349605 RepID=UPI00223CF2B3|nr:PRC-barrel domain-containing protein [Aquabacterium sp. A7-Y]MCW7540261.1 PRC-barrel domain-containing protein [Aquabacterium sp. A7-Y]